MYELPHSRQCNVGMSKLRFDHVQGSAIGSLSDPANGTKKNERGCDRPLNDLSSSGSRHERRADPCSSNVEAKLECSDNFFFTQSNPLWIRMDT